MHSLDIWHGICVKIGDVGIDKVDEHFTEVIETPPLRAPEVAIGARWGKPADIWSLGCTVRHSSSSVEIVEMSLLTSSLVLQLYELYMGRTMFGKNIRDMEVPTMHTMMLGDYPPELIARGKARDEFFNPDGQPITLLICVTICYTDGLSGPRVGSMKLPPERRVPFDKAVRERDTPDASLFADFLRLTFALDPDKRATCRELLQHPWLNL
ncbi:hypothetical protein BN946_scf184943.g37 [Trametes cinnabarina]|uniref:Protein kinase domain-containing protein n=1 Tax=Pycnoporus cinnabarinus TaxID=5643 RepID=A0A060SBW3_PYCCI|nr:hypothetical protein BN946_scf184943.g37 [Trametes cinnabarina]